MALSDFQYLYRTPGRSEYLLARIFSDLYQNANESGWIGRAMKFMAPKVIQSRGRRLGYLGDILWLSHQGYLDVLALSSTVYAAYFNHHGISSIVIPRGYHPMYGAILNMNRDVAAVWLGKLRTHRRAKAVHWIQEQLESQGFKMEIYDGDNKDFIFGEERTIILNRAWFVLNFFSRPYDELSIRFFIAGANGAVVLTEPLVNEYPFINGEHILECSIQEMPGVIGRYLNNEDAWRKISNNMLDLITNELKLENSIQQILNEAKRFISSN